MKKAFEILGMISMAFIAVAIIGYQAERIGRLNDKVAIYEAPAQIQIRDQQDPVKNPYITGITCEILPCGQFTGKYRQCVVACNIERRSEK